jgi:hypothetical protein
MNKARQKEELYGLIGLYGFFILGLLAIDIFYSAWGQMPTGFVVMAIIAHIGVIGCATILLKEWEDPKFDVVRKFFFAFWLASVGFVAGFRVAKNEFNMFQDDVNKAKQQESFIQKHRNRVIFEGEQFTINSVDKDFLFNTYVIQMQCCAVIYRVEYPCGRVVGSTNYHSI